MGLVALLQGVSPSISKSSSMNSVVTARSSFQADGQIHLPRLADVVADHIRERIITGELSEGDRLPRFELLLAEFGVSAPSMREALRILESEGLIAVQRGNLGGAIVHLPTHETAAYTLALVLRSQGTQIEDLRRALTLCERVCATLCAQRPDRNKTVVRELRKCNAAARKVVDDESEFGMQMAVFHASLVRLCGNETFTLVIGALESIFLVHLGGNTGPPSQRAHKSTRESRLADLAVHEEITDLIKAGDETGVSKLMIEHVDLKRGSLEFAHHQINAKLLGVQR